MADSGDASVMMIGLDGAGKTTILNYLKGDRDSTTIPTVGFNVDQIRFDGLDMTMYVLNFPYNYMLSFTSNTHNNK